VTKAQHDKVETPVQRERREARERREERKRREAEVVELLRPVVLRAIEQLEPDGYGVIKVMLRLGDPDHEHKDLLDKYRAWLDIRTD